MTSRSIGIIWWGIWPNNSTIGDLLTLKEVVKQLEKEDLKFTLFSAIEIEGIKSEPIQSMQLDKLNSVLFVCGPITLESQRMRDLVEAIKNQDIPFIGISVSILSSLANPFNQVIAREGLSNSFFDLSPLQDADGIFLMHLKRKLQIRKIKVGVVLRGHQSEYGEEKCNCEKARDLIYGSLSHLERNSIGIEICEIDHVLRGNPLSVFAYDKIYQSCDFVLTTRFHGAIMSVRNLVPFIVVDQIEGGAKVTSLLQELCPEKVLKVDYSAKDLSNDIRSQLDTSLRLKLALLLKARRLARATRREVTRVLSDLPKDD
jgi:hypothetical protein